MIKDFYDFLLNYFERQIGAESRAFNYRFPSTQLSFDYSAPDALIFNGAIARHLAQGDLLRNRAPPFQAAPLELSRHLPRSRGQLPAILGAAAHQ